jgi:multiple sugar transport system ATP-binding protein
VVNDMPPQEREVAMVFQEAALYPHMTVAENLAFGLKLRRVRDTEVQPRVREAVEWLGLGEVMDRLPKALSGGQRQRVALGRALVLRPKLFLLDEPLSNLDAPLRGQMRRELMAMHRRIGTTVLYVTHDQTEAMCLGDRIAVIESGVLQQIGSPREVYHKPRNLFVAGFFGTPAMNFVAGSVWSKGSVVRFEQDPGKSKEVLSFELSRPPDWARAHADPTRVTLGLRPEDIQELDQAEEPTTGAVVVEGRVEAIEEAGSEAHCYFQLGGQLLVARLQPEFKARAGEKIQFKLALGKAHWFDAASGARVPCPTLTIGQEIAW